MALIHTSTLRDDPLRDKHYFYFFNFPFPMDMDEYEHKESHPPKSSCDKNFVHKKLLKHFETLLMPPCLAYKYTQYKKVFLAD